ncbi:MAG TPA: CHAT domain-containing protein [Blastocatellia bacterium]|nr:CHAT domain-containing protein [Blastocatellia bacterium]
MADQPFDVRGFLAHVESANAEELTAILARPGKEQEEALRFYLGDARYQRMHGMALRQRMKSRGVAARPQRKGNVVVLHGMMGSELSVINPTSATELLWVSYWGLFGRESITRLMLGDDGPRGDYEVRATGIMKKYYGELILALNERWNARAFWYDWRKDLNVAADELNAQISSWFGDDTPVHLVAHSMGGLVSRTFVKRHPKRWKAMWDSKSEGRLGGRLVMLGTPNHGSFNIPQLITGLEPQVRKLAGFDPQNGLDDVLRVVNSFAGSYQMLPSPLDDDQLKKLYKSETYGDLNIPQRLLDRALEHHKYLKDAVDTGRMIFVAGDNQITFSGIKDWGRLNSIDSYDVTRKGDGRVTHDRAALKSAGKAVKTYYVEEAHGDLPRNSTVLSAIDELLETGETRQLRDYPLATRSAQGETDAVKRDMLKELKSEIEYDEQSFDRTISLLGGADSASRGRGQTLSPGVDVDKISRGVGAVSSSRLSSEEVMAAESLLRGFLASTGQEKRRDEEGRQEDQAPAEIKLALVPGDIRKIQNNPKARRKTPVIDAISVGHYLGVRPQDAELALDISISRDLPGKVGGKDDEVAEADLLLTQYTARGIIRGELGQPFFLNDPRGGGDRLIALAGMGVPGRFGMPELTVTVRELCWSLGRLGKKHLATVLIGSGNGNLSIADAISGWVRGIRHALSGSPHDKARQLERITFVEYDPRRIRPLQEAIEKAIKDEGSKPDNNSKLKIIYQKLTKGELKKLEPDIAKKNEEDWKSQQQQQQESQLESSVPTRMTVEISEGNFRFGAITENASIPERDIPLDMALVEQANDEMAAEATRSGQLERGRFLEGLLIPKDLRPAMSSNSPLVMMLDSTTARIHWEAMAQPDSLPVPGSQGNVEYEDNFLGTTRGFTRQLRTTFAPPPEPPPPPRRILRVLVVADPAANAPLAGAEEEGLEVAELFESFNKVWNLSDNRVEVVRLSGPREATRTSVLRELMLRSYDVLHYAGHCFYKAENPSASGWIFGKDEYLTANELNRIDRIPKFVFSNACESGVTPERAGSRTVELAPSFAEAFFKRGVSNFVCTAWPVDDVAARRFAITLYSNLLGLAELPDQPNRYERASTDDDYMPDCMHAAMRKARIAIANTPNGVQTWGAYQHYGDPYLRFFDWETLRNRKSDSAAANSTEVR